MTKLARLLDWILVPKRVPMPPDPTIYRTPRPIDRGPAVCADCNCPIDSWPIGVPFVCMACMERRR